MAGDGRSMVGYVYHNSYNDDDMYCHARYPRTQITRFGVAPHGISMVGYVYVYHTLYHSDIMYCHSGLHAPWIALYSMAEHDLSMVGLVHVYHILQHNGTM